MIDTFSMFVLELVLCLINVAIFVTVPNVLTGFAILVLGVMAAFFLGIWIDERKEL